MWALTMIVQDKLLYRAPKVRLAEWDNPIDTIRLDTQDEPFGMRIQIWGTRRKAEWGHTTFNEHLSSTAMDVPRQPDFDPVFGHDGMVEISLSGSGEGPGWVTAPGYSTTRRLGDHVLKPQLVLGRVRDHLYQAPQRRQDLDHRDPSVLQGQPAVPHFNASRCG